MFVRRLFVCVVLMFCCAAALGQVAGQNINMVSGTVWPAGDPYLQRQNEPSMAVSSRNPEHLLGGANDYRTVDIPNPAAPTILGDAWLGVYSSLDGGETWKSTLLPGYPQDTSSIGTSSPLHAFTVATDPTVRAGTNGMFYYSGLAFNRGAGAPSGVFVATFQDQNNKGNGDAAILTTTNGVTHGNAFSYIGVNMVDSGTTGQFLDKPWIVVDIPRSGRTATCKGSDGKTFSSGYVYVVYTQFNGSQNNPSSKIKEVTSTNCGATWNQPQILSQSEKVAQGTVAAIDPNNGNVYVAWRQIAVAGNMNQPDAIQYAVSTNGGWSFSAPPPLFTFAAPTKTNLYPPGSVFDQAQASGTTFRTLDVPTMAVDAKSTVWVAFSERVNGPTAGTYGSRIMITTLASGGSKWTTPYVADSTAPSSAYGHQFMPSLNFAYGKLMLAWFDSRRDNLESVLKCATGGTCADLSQVTVVDQPLPGSTIANPATVFGPTISDPNSGIRHTIDVFGGIVNPSGGPTTFKGFQISQYPYYVDDQNNQIEQGFFNPPNLPMFVQGTTPFIGDYIDIAAQNILPSGSSWVFNTQATDSTGATNAPDFHIAWTDNRDVVPPPVVGGAQDWTQYVPPNGGNSQVSTYTGTGAACPTCTAPTQTTQTACTPVTPDDGTSSSYSGDRNQNVYTSRITNGLVVRFKENAKPLSTSIQRSFSLLVKNTVSPLNTTPLDSPSYYRILLGVTSTTQAPSCTVSGGTANLPGTPNCYLDVAVNPKTTLTQAVTINSTSATASVNVLVAQILAIPPAGTSPTFVGLQALAVINGDASNPSVANPDFLSTDNDDPDVTAPFGVLPIASGEEYDPTVDSPPNPTSGIFTPKIGVPAIFTPKIGAVANSAPQIATPTIFTPKITSIFTPKINSIEVANPTIVNTIFTPKIFTPKIFTPKIVSPDIFTPKITDLSDGTNPVTDYSWRVSNKGNTSASYDTTEFAKSSGVSCCPASCSATPNQCTITATNPAGPNCSVCQLVQQKVYQSPVANRDATNMNATCDLTVQQQYITVANVPDPAFSAGSIGGNSPANPTTSTLSLSPGEGNRVTLRTMAPAQTGETVGSFKTVATAFTADKGQNTPAGSLTIATSALPVAVVGQTYTNTTLASVGGFGATAWSIPPDPTNPVAVTLPIAPEPLRVTPLTLNQSGQISPSVVTAGTGSYTVNMQVQDAAVTPSLDVQQVQLEVNSFAITNVNVAISNEFVGTSFMKAGDSATVSVSVTSTGPANASNVIPTLTVNTLAAGTQGGAGPVVTCFAPTPASASITGTGTQMFNFTCTASNGNGYVTFTANATGFYDNAAANVMATATPVSEPAVTPGPIPANVLIDTVAPTLAFGTTTSTQSAPGWYNAPVVIPFTTADNLSGVMSAIATLPAISSGVFPSGAMTLTTEGKLVTGTMTVTDFAKNTASPFVSAGFNIDETKPTISGLASPVANAAGWNNGPVTVGFTCMDPNPNNGPAGQQSGIATCNSPVVVPGEGNSLSASGTAVDNAANSASTTVTGIKIDTTPPTIIGSATPAADSYGWNSTSVTVAFACADPNPLHGPAGQQSGIATCTSPVILSGEGANQSVLGTAVDQASNSTPVSVSGINIDKTPPVVTPSSTYSPNVWTNQSVTVVFTCTDNLSGPVLTPTVNPIITGIPAVGSTLTYTQPNSLTSVATVTLTANTPFAGTTLSASCQDLAGNNAQPASFGPILIDTTPPVVTATANLTSSNGPAYAAGSWTNQSVVVTFACSDALSGVKPGSITGNSSFGAQGVYTANGSCQDVAGNVGTGSFGPVQIDTTTPSVMIAAPTQTTYILNQPITPSFSCPDDGGGDSVTCTPTPAGSPYNATPVGPSTFTVNAVDQASNSSSASVSYLVIYNFTGFQAPLQNAVMTPYPSGTATPSDSGFFAIGATIPIAWQLQDASSTFISDLATLTSIVAYPNATCAGPASGSGTTLYSSGSNNPAFAFANNTFTFSWNTTGMAEGCYNVVVTTNDTAQWSTIVHLGQTFAVGTTPYAIAFDGTNLWVPGYGSNNVTELVASTGAVVGTYSVGNGPDGVFFDKTNIWVANTTDNTVTKLSATGATLGTFPVGSQPWGIASDGTNIWVTNRGSNTVTKLLASTGATVATYAVGAGPYGIAFDGTNMWVANDYASTVTELVASTGTVVGTYAVGASPVGVVFDGTNIWVADQTGAVGTVTKLAPTGAVIGTYPAGPAPNGILFDGTNIWVTNNSRNTVTKLLASTGAIVGTYTIGTGPYGIAFDGTNIWVTVPGNNSVTELPAL